MPFFSLPTHHTEGFGQYIWECTLVNWCNWEANLGQLALINLVTCLTNKEHNILPASLKDSIEKKPTVWFNFPLYPRNLCHVNLNNFCLFILMLFFFPIYYWIPSEPFQWWHGDRLLTSFHNSLYFIVGQLS